jgi:hypothetical protein
MRLRRRKRLRFPHGIPRVPITPEVPDKRSCAYLGKGFCPASVDGYCVGGTSEGMCHG